MPPAPPDSPVGRASGPLGVAHKKARRTRSTSRSPARAGTSRPPRSQPGDALESLLADLGSQIQRGSSESARSDQAVRCHPTGLTLLDDLLGGGFPCGRMSEICGTTLYARTGSRTGRSSGRTSIALGVLAETLGRGVLAAWVDLADAFDPPSAVEAILAHGGEEEDLDRLLWVRARSEDEALRSCERLLQTEGFELVILDALLPGTLVKAHFREVTWLRLARLAAGTRTALLVLSSESVTGSRSAVVLEMKARRTRFVGPPNLLDAIETSAVLRRHRGRPTGQEIVLSIQADTISAGTIPVETTADETPAPLPPLPSFPRPVRPSQSTPSPSRRGRRTARTSHQDPRQG